MTTFTTIPNSSLEPGKPIRSIDGLALRDNPIAMFEGNASAPKLADAALSTTVTNAGRDWVLARTAVASVGAVGTYALMKSNNTTAVSPGGTKAGSLLSYSSASGAATGAATGTWRCMGYDNSSYDVYGSNFATTLWLRIS